MSYRTNPDRILEGIDRARSRNMERALALNDRRTRGWTLDSTVPEPDATTPERMARIFGLVETAYRNAAAGREMGPLAARFQKIGDISSQDALGDVSVSVQFLGLPAESLGPSDRGMRQWQEAVDIAAFHVKPEDLREAELETRTSRPDINAMKVLRLRLRDGVRSVCRKIEGRIREALRERADFGHVQVEVTLDIRPADAGGPDEAEPQPTQ